MQDQQLPKPSKPSSSQPKDTNPQGGSARSGGGGAGGGAGAGGGSGGGANAPQSSGTSQNPQQSKGKQVVVKSPSDDTLPPPSAMKSAPAGSQNQQVSGLPPTTRPADAQPSSLPVSQKPAGQSQIPVPVPASQAPASTQTPTQASIPTPTQTSQAAPAKPNQPTQMPPTAITALSSMASTQLPQGAAVTLAPEARPEIQDNPNLRAATPEERAQVERKRVVQNAPRLVQVPGQQGAPTAQPQQQSAPLPTSSPPTQASAQPQANQPQPVEAKPKKSFTKFLPFLAIGVVVLLIVGFLVSRFMGDNSSGSVRIEPSDTSGSQGSGNANSQSGGSSTGPTTPGKQVSLEYWGLWEPSQVLEQVIADFQKENPGITVRYTKQSHKDYRERLQTAIASGNGPDVFRFHATWVPMMRNDLQPLPSSTITPADFKNNYYSDASEQLQSGGQPVGIPLMYDGLALLYNKDIFDTAGEKPPTTWAELRTLASKLKVTSGRTLERGGIALGNATNVDHFSDILGLLLLQNGADPNNPSSSNTVDALKFYTNFQTADGVWDERMPESTVAFARGDVAMIFAPSWRIHDILAMNPKLNFGVAPVPRLSDQQITWSNYWAEGVSARSQKKEEAYIFLKYLSKPETMERLYGSASQVRAFGEIYPRKDMADKLADNEYVTAYLQDAPHSKSWYLSSATHDNGLNDQMIKYYADAITAIVGGKKAEDTIETIVLGTSQLLRQYGVEQ